MWNRRINAGVVLGVCVCVVLLGCSNGEEMDPVGDDGLGSETGVSRVVVPVAVGGVVNKFATITPWPTFTVAPTVVADIDRPFLSDGGGDEDEVSETVIVTPTLVVEVAEADRVPTATFEPLPTVDLAEIDGFEEEVFATPTVPVYYTKLGGTDVGLVRQSLIMRQVKDAVSYVPRSQNVFYERTARHIQWYLELDYSEVDSDFSMDAELRWLSFYGGKWNVMYQRDIDHIGANRGGNIIAFGLGNDEPGMWSAGDYRVEIWDSRDRVIVGMDFKVIGMDGL